MTQSRIELKPSDLLFKHLCRDLESPPSMLYIQGQISKWEETLWQIFDVGLTIVGTRNPDPRAVQLVHKVVDDLRSSPLCIVSGLARGIDGAAHRSAVRAGLPTIAVIGSGLDQLYPTEHRALADQLAESGGLLITEHPPLYPALKSNFVKRNRLLAHWCKAVWLVQAPLQSGARHTVNFAFKKHKSVYVSCGIPGDPGFELNESLLLKEACNPLWRAKDFELDFGHLKKAKHINAEYDAESTLETGHLTHELSLIREIKNRQFRYRTEQVPLEDLIQWAHAQHWTSAQFFEALDQLLLKSVLQEKASRVWLQGSF